MIKHQASITLLACLLSAFFCASCKRSESLSARQQASATVSRSPTNGLPQSGDTGDAKPEGDDWKKDPTSNWSNVLDLARKDPAAASALFDAFPGLKRNQALANLVTMLAEEDLNRLPRLLRFVPKDEDRTATMQTVLGKWCLKDVNKVIEFARHADSRVLRIKAYECSAQFLAQSHAFGQAASLIEELPKSTARHSAVMNLTTALSFSDPENSLAEVQSSLSDPDDIADATRQFSMWVIPRIADKKGIQGMVNLANSSTDSRIIGSCVDQIAKLLPANSTPASVSKWIDSLPDEYKDSAISEIIGQNGPSNPSAWVAYASQIKEERERLGTIRNLASKLADDDSAKAAAFATGLTNQADAEAAIQSVVQTWYRRDPVEVRKWIDSLPPGGQQDAALSEIITTLFFTYNETNRATARTLVSRIRDPNIRKQAQDLAGQP